MKNSKKYVRRVCHYYVDESGDGVLFNKRGRLLLNNPACRQYFMLGLIEITCPEKLNKGLDELRAKLIHDPYFRNIPSMQREARKTALFFHAKDDLPEVRREVFKLLLQHELRFFAAVKSMWSVYQYVSNRNLTDSSYRYHPNELYDLTVRRLFKPLLHKKDRYIIHFARRGNTPRSKSLLGQLNKAKSRFCEQHGLESDSVIDIFMQHSYEEGGLQAVDYFLWALQRMYEAREDRYLNYIWDKVSLVVDIDDTRERQYGVYYTKKKPLILAALPPKGPRI